jgi:hypothetical protein
MGQFCLDLRNSPAPDNSSAEWECLERLPSQSPVKQERMKYRTRLVDRSAVMKAWPERREKSTSQYWAQAAVRKPTAQPFPHREKKTMYRALRAEAHQS